MTRQITKAEAVNEIRKNGKGFFNVVFVKKCGEIRSMTCRLGVKKHLSGGKNTVAHIPKYITVWDTVKRDYRNLCVNTIQSLNINGNNYIVE